MFSPGVELGWVAGSLATGLQRGSGVRPLFPAGKALSLDLSCCGPACSQGLLAAESLGGGSWAQGIFRGLACTHTLGQPVWGLNPGWSVTSLSSHRCPGLCPPVLRLRIPASSLF